MGRYPNLKYEIGCYGIYSPVQVKISPDHQGGNPITYNYSSKTARTEVSPGHLKLTKRKRNFFPLFLSFFSTMAQLGKQKPHLCRVCVYQALIVKYSCGNDVGNTKQVLNLAFDREHCEIAFIFSTDYLPQSHLVRLSILLRRHQKPYLAITGTDQSDSYS